MPYKVGKRTVYLEGENQDQFPSKTLAKGQIQDFNAIKAACKASGTQFEDPEFDVINTNVVGDVHLVQRNPGIVIAWKRPREVDPSLVFSKPNAAGLRYNRASVRQGQLGDCFYVTSVGLVSTNQKLINFVIPEDNLDDDNWGIYHFRFWVKGDYFDIVVDDRCPYVQAEDGTFRTAFIHLEGAEYWPMVIEKAYAKLYGSYRGIQGGHTPDALQDFTGGLTQVLKLEKHKLTFDDLVAHDEISVFVGFGTPKPIPDPSSGLHGGHAYSLVSKDTVTTNDGTEVKLLRLKNPWGHGEWKWGWSDGSPLWNTVPAEEKERLDVIKDEGEFWIALEYLQNPDYFTRGNMCYWLDDLDNEINPNRFQFQQMTIKLQGEGEEASDDDEAMAGRPQYVINIKTVGDGNKNDGMLIVSLIYKNYLVNKRNMQSGTLFLYRVTDPALKFPLGADDISKLEPIELFKATHYSDGREYCTAAKLETGTYVVIPKAWSEDDQDYLFRVLCQGQFTSNLYKPNAADGDAGGSVGDEYDSTKGTGGDDNDDVDYPDYDNWAGGDNKYYE